MAEGLSIPAISQGFGENLRSLFDLARTSSQQQTAGSGAQRASNAESTSAPPLGDFFDFGNDGPPPQAFGPGGRFQLAPDGTYRFRSFEAEASFDLAFSQSTVEVAGGEDNSSVFASLTELNFSFSFSARFEETLLEVGRNRGGNPRANFENAAQGLANRFASQQISATLNFELSLSQTSVSINDAAGGLTEELEGVLPADLLNGFATLLETFFKDDERFADFVQNLKNFLNGVSGASTGEAPAPVEGGEGAPATEAQEGQSSGDSVNFQSTSLNISFNLSLESTQIEIAQGGEANASDPIVLDLNGDGIDLTSVQDGVDFDLTADGRKERIATVAGGDGFLVLDRNGNGTIDNGSELFGDQNGAANGFEELRKFDSNRDGVIDSKDDVFDRLQVFVDRNLDGLSQSGELYTLAALGIESISLNYRNVQEKAAGGNSIAQRSNFTYTDGRTGQAADVLLNYLA